MILHCGRLLAAIEELSDAEQVAAADLKSDAITAAITALAKMEGNEAADDAMVNKLLDDEKLAALRRTPEFAQWVSSR